jgi:predicted ATPase/DNA-binding winged helix-turn-helix (wHTH) protein
MLYAFEDYELDLQCYELRHAGRPVKIEPQVFNLLAYLIRHRDRVVSKEELLEQLWPGRIVGEATLTSRVKAARRSIGDRGREQRLIQTVHGRGYRFIAPVEELPDGVSAQQDPHQPSRLPALIAQDEATMVAEGVPLQPSQKAVPRLQDAVLEACQEERRPPPLLSVATRRTIGREAELAQLHSWLHQALQGTRQVVFVTGETGLGKTTLVEAFLEDVGGDGRLWVGRGQCLEHYGVGEAYLPVLEALGRLCRQPDGQTLLALLVRQAPTWVVQMPWLVDDVTLDTLQRRVIGATRERMLREMAEAIEVLTTERPLILVLEDLHWSDASTIDLIASLARRREPTRLLLLGTYRPAEAMLHGHPLQMVKHELGIHGQCHELPLRLWSAAETAEYLAARFPGTAFPAEMTRFLHQRTDGNPLFTVNVVDYWQAQGLPVETEAPSTLLEWFAALGDAVPETLRKLIEQQLGQLGRDDQRLLEAASVAGKEFAAAAVAAGVERETEHVEGILDALARRGQFVHAQGIAEWPDGTVATRYAFIHDLYRAILYDRVPAGQRLRWHRHIGLRLEAGYGARAPELAAELAEHFVRGRDVPRAVRYLSAAGETALRRSAYHEAIRHLSRGVELLPELADASARTAHELHLQVALGAALTANKGFAAAEAGQAYTRARELSRQVADSPQLAPMLLGLWVYYHVRAELGAAHELGEELLGLARRWQDPLLRHQAHHALGITSTDMGAFAEALGHAEQAVALYTPEQHRTHTALSVYDTGAICLAFAAHNLWYLGYPDQAARRNQEALALAEALAHPYTTAGTLCLAALFASLRRDAQQAQEWAAAVMALSQAQSFPYMWAWGAIVRRWALSVQGQSHEGIALLRQGLAAYRATGAAVLHTYWLLLYAEALGQAGDAEAALGVLDEALAAIPGSGEHRSEAELYRFRGELLQRIAAERWPAGLTPAACFQRALDIAGHQQAKSLELRAATSLSRLWQRQGKHRDARQLLTELYSWFSEGFDTADLMAARGFLEQLTSSTWSRRASPSPGGEQTPQP